MDVENQHPAVFIALAVVWLTLVLNTIFSIRLQKIETRHRFAWMFVVTFIPVLGMLAYLIWNLTLQNYQFLKFLAGSPSSKAVKRKY